MKFSTHTILFVLLIERAISTPVQSQTKKVFTAKQDLLQASHSKSYSEVSVNHRVSSVSSYALVKRQPPAVSVRKQSVFHFSCPRLGINLGRMFRWGAEWNSESKEVDYLHELNIDHFDGIGQALDNPVMYKAIWHHTVCIQLSRDTKCYLHFWQHFYGQVYGEDIKTHMSMIAPTSMQRRDVMPGVEEYCVPANSEPTANTPRWSCTIRNINVSEPEPEASDPPHHHGPPHLRTS